jgi:tRNA 2-selenouridine synthase
LEFQESFSIGIKLRMIPPSKYIFAQDLEEFKREDFRIIDVRSPAEFEEDHIPNSENFPVLDNSERIIVGTLYKKDTFLAKQLGAKLITKNISSILEEVEKSEISFKQFGLRKPETKFLIYCWRGGMRSSSLFTVMDLIGYKTYILNGGYKQYRSNVNSNLNSLNIQSVYVLHGPSGSGKTEILSRLEEEGFPILNLEKFANHNGSVFGDKINSQPSQKYFETCIYERLNKLKKSNYLIFEGESRKIGKLLLPTQIYNHIERAKRIWIELPLQVRISRLKEEYSFSNEDFLSKLQFIKRYIKSEVYSEIINSYKLVDKDKAVSLLLSEYYDLYYKKTFRLKNSPTDKMIYEETIDSLLNKIRKYIKENVQNEI